MKFIDYFTEQDLIDRYSAKRKNMPREDIEDLYKAIYKFILINLEDTKSEKMGFHVKNFCSFLHKRLKIGNLKMGLNKPQYKRAEEQLHHYLSGYQRLKIEE